MEISEIVKALKTLKEDKYEDLSVEQVAKIISEITVEDIELFDDDKIRRLALETRYEKYPMYSLDSQIVYIIRETDFINYVKDLASHFAACLPDKFDRLFNTDGLADAMLDDFSYSWQATEFINKFDGDYDDYKIIGSTDGWVALQRVYNEY